MAPRPVLIVHPDSLTFPNRERIMSITARSRLPVLVADAPGWDAAVLRFGPYLTDMPGRAAEFVDKILRGANPAELPVDQPTKYGLVVDLKLARALGLKIAPAALIRADRVIE